MANIEATSVDDQLNSNMKDENYIKEFCNYVIFEGCSKAEAFSKTFGVPTPFNPSMNVKVYRWIKKDIVQKWLKKANSSLEVDWIDKRVNALSHLYSMGMNQDNSVKEQTAALDVFLTKLDKEQNKILLDMGNTQVNIVQVVQEKLNTITQGAIINPSGLVEHKKSTFSSRADEAMEAIILKRNEQSDA